MNAIDLLQWPATAATIGAAWLVASESSLRRNVGFWIFLLSNALWIVWAVHAAAPALIVLQLGLAAMNIRGAIKTARAARKASGGAGAEPAAAPALEPNANPP